MYRTVRESPAAAGSERASRTVPWPEMADGWTSADRLEYGRALRPEAAAPPPSARAPAMLRESLQALGDGCPDDEEVRRERYRWVPPDAWPGLA